MQWRRVVGYAAAATALAGAMFFALAGSAFAADYNADCITCHSASGEWDVASVDFATACKKCHLPGLVGTHPIHNAGSNCGAYCHPGWGASTQFATPTWSGSPGAFASPQSPSTPASVIHVIHSKSQWMASLSTATSNCSSCHSIAACDACHTNPPAARHADHSSETSWTGVMGEGTPPDDLSVETAVTQQSKCASAGCHNLSATQSRTVNLTEDNAAAGLTKTGAWYTRYGSAYTAGRVVWASSSTASIQLSFTGKQIEILSDKDPYRGRAEVYLDNVLVDTIDFYAPTTTYQNVIYRSPLLTDGAHTLKLKVLGTKNVASRASYVFFDAFRYYTNLPESISPACTSCHPERTQPHGAAHDASNTVGVTYTSTGSTTPVLCTSCHTTELLVEHARTSAVTSQAASLCSECHEAYMPTVDPVWDYTCGYAPCHQGTETMHSAQDTSHTVTPAQATADGTTDCVGCHGNNLGTIHDDTNAARAQHASLTGAGSNGLSYTTGCVTCHSSSAVPATKDCTSAACHAASGVVSMATHPAPEHDANPALNESLRTGGYACSACHAVNLPGNVELVAEHGKGSAAGASGAIGCMSCHGAAYFPTDWLGANNTCVACHPADATKAGAPHEAADYTAKHNFSGYASNSSCSTLAFCHNTAMADVQHSATVSTCTACHTTSVRQAGVPTIVDCATSSCHPATTLPHDMSVHVSSASAECVNCHESGDVRTVHAGIGDGCNVCHGTGGFTDVTAGKTAECVSCHNATGVYAKTYTTPDPAHYTGTETTHTASAQTGTVAGYACNQCHSLEMKPEHITKSSSAFSTVSGTYPDKCVACHEAKADTITWGKTCDVCHATKHTAASTQHDFSSGNAACAGAGCHDTADVTAIHAGTPADGITSSCLNCHTNNTSVPTKRLCADCHTAHPATGVHDSTTTECTACHVSKADISTGHAACATCHADARLTDYLQTHYTDNCLDCHTNGVIGTATYSPADANHYDPKLANHTASAGSMAALAGDKACTACHATTLKAEHALTISATVGNGDASVDCIECHTDTTLGSAAQVAANWASDSCSDCHGALHNSVGTSHDMSASATALGCAGASCHDGSDVSTLHLGRALSTNATITSCNLCHVNADTALTATGCDSTGCHSGASAHNHALDAATSAYSIAAQTGCTSSGAGCHASSVTDYASTDYHPANGCLTGGCHTAANHNDASFDNPNSCQDCHGGGALLYVGAPDVVATSGLQIGDHYNETTHTMTPASSVSAGGTYSATCATCHNPGTTTATDGLVNQHTGIRTGTLTCYACHNRNAAIQAIVADDVALGSCAGCHNGTIVEAQHGAAAPAVAGSEAQGIGTCQTAGCHTTLDLHALHANNNSGNANGCTIAGCHDSAAQGVKPTAKSCGTGGSCHTSEPHPAHLSTASVECVNCHESADAKVVHASAAEGACAVCHSHPTFGDVAASTTGFECVTCHNATGVGSKTYTPANADHYVGTEVVHTASLQSGTVGGFACTQCHKVEMKPEHIDKTSSAFSTVPGTYADKCVACHEVKADSVTWNSTCDVCHAVKHDAVATKHNATSVDPGCAGVAAPPTDVTNTTDFEPVTWPSAWTVATSSGNGWVRGTTTPYAGVGAADMTAARNTGTHTSEFAQTFNLAGMTNPQISFWYMAAQLEAGADVYAVEYSTNGGGSWTPILAQNSTNLAWTQQSSFALPAQDGVIVRFRASMNNTNVGASETVKFDNVVVTWTAPGSGSSCHSVTDVSVIHANSVTTNAATMGDASCATAGCHDNNNTLPATLDCDSAGCHVTSHAHPLDTTNSAGCYSSGAGCHASADPDYTTYHPSNGCLTGACHTATNHDDAQFNGTISCQTCHGGGATLYSGAPDTVALTDAVPNGHYSAALHTAPIMTTAVGAYTYNNTCSDCHSTTLPVAHSNTGAVNGGSVTCTECHNDATLGSTNQVKLFSWTNDACSDCHAVSHTSYTDGTHTASANAGCTLQSGCHGYTGSNSFDVRALHDTADLNRGCTSTGTDSEGWTGGCHALDKPMTAGSLTCGGGVGCHANHTDATHGPDHGYTTASNYTQAADAIGSEAGCTASGMGCHDSAAAGDAINTFHGAVKVGCTDTDACHSDPQFDATFALGSGADCSRCHNATAGIGRDRQPLFEAASAGHYGETTHTATVMGTPVSAGGTATATCATCHSAGLRNAHGATGGPLATSTKGAYVTCQECHGYSAAVSAVVADATHSAECAQCHAIGVLGGTHAVHATTAPVATVGTGTGCATTGNGCHASGDLHAIHKDAASCALSGCHDAINKSLNASTTSCGQTTGCHLNTQYTAASHNGTGGLADGDDTAHHQASTHTGVELETSWAQSTLCSNCHSLTMKTAHATTSLASDPSCSTGGTGNTGCHNQTTPINATPQVTSDWSAKTCDACHTSKHTTYTAGEHTATTAGCTLSSGCHGFSGSQSIDIRGLHDVTAGCTATGTDGEGWTGKCHSVDYDISGQVMTCGDTGACHSNHTDTNHGPDHDYTAASNYAQTGTDVVGGESGCTNSGTGCHPSTATGNAITTFHSAITAGCTATDACHSDPQFANATWRLGTSADCSRCHGGATDPGVGADNAPLYEAASAGHYKEAIHTASGMTATVSAGGTRTAACTVCHSSTFRNAHGAAGSSFASTSKGAYVTCQECHGYSAAVGTVVTDAVRDDACAACHASGVLGASHVVHGNAPVATGTGTSCASTGVNCHGSDLHNIHKDAASCALTGCHAADKDMATATKSCGSASGGCHNTYTQANHYATYIGRHTSATQGAQTTTVGGVSPTCASCHGMELNPEHTLANSALTGTGATVCERCHGEAPGTFDGAADNWTNDLCSDCHGQTGISSSHTNMAAHNVVNTGCGASGVGCHPTQDLSQAGANKSLYIHNDCATCHDPAGAASWTYGVAGNLKYNPLANTCGGATGCHTSTFYSTTAHKIGQADVVNGDDAIHTASGMSTSLDTYTYGDLCSDCHSAKLNTAHATTSLASDASCSTGGTGNVGCHNSTALPNSPTQVKANWTNNTCADCHTTSHTGYTAATHTATASGCVLSGTCHSFDGDQTVDIRGIHDKVGVGCTATGDDSKGATPGCHALNTPMSGALTCGDTGTCHPNHTATNHMPDHLVTNVTSQGCLRCHESGAAHDVATSSVIEMHSVTTIGTPVSGKVNNGCNICHGGDGWTDLSTTGQGFECVNCHETRLGFTYDPYDPDHYTGTETIHSASSQTGTEGSVACSWCHSLEMKPEHITKATSAFATVPGTHVDKCVACHEIKVDAIGTWTKTCDECHAAKHTSMATKHDAQAAGFGASCYQAGTTTVQTLHSETFDSVTAPAWPATWTTGGTNPALQVTSTTASSTPNAATFKSDANGTARSGYFQKTLDTSGKTNPRTSFAYRTDFPVAGGTATPVTLRPDATAANAWTITGDATAHGAVDEVAQDGNTTSLSTTVKGAATDIDVGTFTLGSGTVNSVTAYGYVNYTGTAEFLRFRYNNGDGWASSATNLAVGTAYGLVSETIPTPAGGWTQANLDALGAGFVTVANGGWASPTYRCTQLYIVVNYTPATPADPTANYLKAQYSTNGGSTWTDMLSTSTTTGWTTVDSAVPQSASLLVRFSSASDRTDRVTYVDDIYVKYDQVTSGCHNTADVGAIHANSVPGNTKLETAGAGCKVCHTNNTSLPTTLNCANAGCHPTSPHTHDLDTTTSAGCYNTGAGCHNSASLLYDDAAYHATGSSLCMTSGCHTSASQPNAAFDNPVGCLECHDAQYVGAPDTAPRDTVHYTDALHAAAGMTTEVDASYSLTNACSSCHTSTLKAAHATTSAGAVGCTTGGVGDNEGCHNDTDLPSTTQIKLNNWTNDLCSDCHLTYHSTYTPAEHTATTAGCTLASGCHGFTGSQSIDVRGLHDVSAGCTATGTDGQGWTGKCHSLDYNISAQVMTCGDTGACHSNHTATNHGPDHDYTTASNYAQTGLDAIGGESGCTNSGTGCHPSAATGDAITTFHSAVATGCTATDACHSDPQFANATWRTGTGADCSRCHGGATDPGVGADNQALFEAASAGHYKETVHTDAAMTTPVGAGGTATATCATCHSASLRSTHGAAGGPLVTTTKGAYLTCQECHGYSAAVSAVITDATVSADCAQCHVGTVLGATHVVHATTAPVATVGTGTGCATTGNGCHASSDLHAIHKDAASCALSGCHDALNKSLTASTTKCGQTTGCHLNTQYTALQHNGTSGAGLANGDDATHHSATANAGLAWNDATYTTSTLCTVCHSTDKLNTAHATTSLASDATCATGGTGNTGCHNQTTPVNATPQVTSDWTAKTCEACHTTKHTTDTLATHTATPGTGCTIGTCHGGVTDVRAIHDRVTSGCTATGGDSLSAGNPGCHALNKPMNTVGTMSCGSTTGSQTTKCHVSHTSNNHGVGGGPCLGCHGASSTERLDKMVNDTTTYHHVLDGGDGQANLTSTTSIGCRTCHVDHGFSTKATNLKTGVGTTVATNTDYSSTAPYGICLSCHTSAVTRTSTAQKAGGNASIPAVDQAAYNASMHNYALNNGTTVGFGAADPIKGNCIKCHNSSAMGVGRQTGTMKIAPHLSTENRLASALGAANVGATTTSEENLCFGCHITAGALAGDAKTVAGKDGYNSQAMSTTSEGIYTDFQQTYKHNVQAYSGVHTSSSSEYTNAPTSVAPGAATGWWGTSNASKHVECDDCHDVHTVGAKRPAPSATSVRAANTAVAISPANNGAWGVNISGAASGLWNPAGTLGTRVDPTYSKISPAQYEWQLCLKCHSIYAWGNNPPTVSYNLGMQTGGKQTDVGKDFSPTQYAYHPLFQQGRNKPSLTANGDWDGAGSRYIGGTTANHGLSNTFVDGWLYTSLVTCTDCHGSNVQPGPSGAHGSSRKWMLKSVDQSIKVTTGVSTVLTPNSTFTAAELGNFCMNCHRRDVYGDGTAQGPTYQGFARMSHNSDWNGSCAGVANTKQAVSGCMNCHGGRRDDSSFNNPANTVVQSGAVHGTTIDGRTVTEQGNAPAYTATPLGYRFANGASWHTHQYDFNSNEALGCQTVATDNYSSCNKHNTGTTKANPANYSYAP